MSVASRTHAPDIARQLLGGLYVVPPADIAAAAEKNGQWHRSVGCQRRDIQRFVKDSERR